MALVYASNYSKQIPGILEGDMRDEGRSSPCLDGYSCNGPRLRIGSPQLLSKCLSRKLGCLLYVHSINPLQSCRISFNEHCSYDVLYGVRRRSYLSRIRRLTEMEVVIIGVAEGKKEADDMNNG